MAHTYIINQILSQGTTIIINGQVNGAPVSATIAASAWPPANVAGLENLLTGPMLNCMTTATVTLATTFASSWTST